MKLPPTIRLAWRENYRVIPTQHPYIDVFDNKGLSDDEKAALWALQKRTHRRHVESPLAKNRSSDIATGHNAYFLNGPFIHSGNPSRFTDGSYGVYYAAHNLKTSVLETKFGYERVWRASRLEAQIFKFRALKGTRIKRPLYDLRQSIFYRRFLNPDIATYPRSQAFARALRSSDPDAWGLVYSSVRDLEGECIAIFRPSALNIPTPSCLLFYEWNGKEVTRVSEGKTLYEF